MKDAIPFAIIVWLCGALFISIGIYSLKKKTPMHFWSGTTVKPEEISNIKAYNKANGVMWISYGLIFVLSGILGFLVGTFIGAIIVVLISTIGLIILITIYTRIHDKYKIK